jgi:hypothetical protein
VTLGVALSGCGGSSSVSAALDPVAKAASISTSTPGYKIKLTMQFSSAQLPSGLTATGGGAFDVRDHAGSFAIEMNLGNNPQANRALGSNTLHIDEVIDHQTIYVKLPAAIGGKIPGGKPWLKVDLAKLGSAAGVPGLSSLASNPAGSDPSQMLQYLRAVSGTITQVGSETVNGTATTHYRATVSLDRVAGQVPEAQRQAAQSAIAAMEKMTNLHALPVDVWIDSGHYVRRMLMTFAENLPTGQALTAKMTIDFSDYGPQPRPAVPSADQAADLSALLGGSLQGLGSGTSTGP